MAMQSSSLILLNNDNIEKPQRFDYAAALVIFYSVVSFGLFSGGASVFCEADFFVGGGAVLAASAFSSLSRGRYITGPPHAAAFS